MATAKDFITRVDQIDGVNGCLLIRANGSCIGQTLEDIDAYTVLIQDSVKLSDDIMEKNGFSFCRNISFRRGDNGSFYVFPIKNYFLGVLLDADCSKSTILERVYQLINRVSVAGSVVVT